MCVSVAGEAVGGDGGHHGTRNNAYGKSCPPQRGEKKDQGQF